MMGEVALMAASLTPPHRRRTQDRRHSARHHPTDRWGQRAIELTLPGQPTISLAWRSTTATGAYGVRPCSASTRRMACASSKADARSEPSASDWPSALDEPRYRIHVGPMMSRLSTGAGTP